MAKATPQYLITVELAEALRTATAYQMKIAGRNFANIVKLYRSELGDEGGWRRVNQALATSMHEEVLNAYRDRVLSFAVPSYRGGEGRYPGALIDALEDPSMAVGTANEIRFINTKLLSRKARFWARLNFGTEGTGGQSHNFEPVNVRIQFGANQGFNLRLTEPRRPAFRIPEFPRNGTNKGLGFFNAAGQFFPGYEKGNKENKRISRSWTRGIGARRFLDQGLVALKRDIKPFYEEYVQEVNRRVQSRLDSKGLGS